jgi:hypothetical protein
MRRSGVRTCPVSFTTTSTPSPLSTGEPSIRETECSSRLGGVVHDTLCFCLQTVCLRKIVLVALCVHVWRGARCCTVRGKGTQLPTYLCNHMCCIVSIHRRWFAAQLRPPKDYKQQQEQQQQDQQQQEPGPGASSSSGAAPPPAAAAAAAPAAGSNGSSSSTVSPELQGVIAAGQDKNSAAYRAAVRIQSRFR